MRPTREQKARHSDGCFWEQASADRDSGKQATSCCTGHRSLAGSFLARPQKAAQRLKTGYKTLFLNLKRYRLSNVRQQSPSA